MAEARKQPLTASRRRRFSPPRVGLIFVLIGGLFAPLILSSLYTFGLQRDLLQESFDYERERIVDSVANALTQAMHTGPVESSSPLLDEALSDSRIVAFRLFDDADTVLLSAGDAEIRPQVSEMSRIITLPDNRAGRVSLFFDSSSHDAALNDHRQKIGLVVAVEFALLISVVALAGWVYTRHQRAELLRDNNVRLRAELAERRWVEEKLRLTSQAAEYLRDIAVAVNLAGDPDEAIQICLDAVCENCGWPVGHAYRFAPDKSGALVSTGIWHLDERERFAEFQAISQGLRIEPGAMLVSRVAASGKPIWLNNDDRAPVDPRAQTRVAAGLQSGFAAPVLVGSKAVAVLEFFTDDIVERDENLLEFAGQIGLLIGRAIERQQMELERRTSEQRLAGIVDIAPEAIISVDTDGRISLFNAGAEAIFGYSADEAISQPLDILLPERIRESHQELVARFLASDEISRHMSQRGAIIGRRRDGSEFPAQASISKLKLADEVVLTVILRDITEQQRIEQALSDSETRYRQMAELSPDGMFVHVDGEIVFANESLAKLIGVNSAEEVIGTPVRNLFAAENHPDLQSRIDQILESGLATSQEAEFVLPDGSRLPIERSGTRMSWQGRPAVLSLVRDITERKRVEQTILAARDEAERASKSKSEFLANMSHELRTPLNAIIGFSDLAHDELANQPASAEIREYVGHIYKAGQHLLAMINDILDIAKVEAGHASLREETVDLGSLALDCCAMLRERARAGRVELSLDTDEELLPNLRADPVKLKQIAFNLLSNAVKFTEPGGSVTVKVWFTSASGFVFQVADTGIGIAPEDIPKALARFQQIDGALNRKQEGTGLGLPLTKALVEQHGGTLDLQSEVGRGTIVTVRLPASRAMAEQSQAAA